MDKISTYKIFPELKFIFNYLSGSINDHDVILLKMNEKSDPIVNEDSVTTMDTHSLRGF